MVRNNYGLFGLALTQSIIAGVGYAGNGAASAPQLRIANCELRIFQTPDSGFRNPQSAIRNRRAGVHPRRVYELGAV
jgi:hypothetical protein